MNDIKLQGLDAEGNEKEFSLNDFKGQRVILYFYPKDNFALQFAIQKSKELNLPLKIIHPKVNYKYPQKQKFIDSQVTLLVIIT